MSAPSVLERCRMALAEIGYSPDLVSPPARSTVDIGLSPTLPMHVLWMLRCTVYPETPTCWPCEKARREQWRVTADVCGVAQADDEFYSAGEACRADRPFQRVSCGVSPEVQP